MNKRIFVAASILIVSAIAAIVFMPGKDQALISCGPFFSEPVYQFSVHPDFPLKNYAKGELGILRPEYARSYLAVAYRYLNNQPLTANEQQGALNLWDTRLNRYEWDTIDRVWIKERNRILKQDTEIYIEKNAPVDTTEENRYNYYESFTHSAFENAINVLHRLEKQYGVTSLEVKDWVRNQDAIFLNRGGVQPVVQTASAEIKHNRAYQLAAYHFYHGQYDDAVNEFDQIAIDNGSPWRALAPYLSVRALIRKGTLEQDSALRIAEQRLRAILNDPSRANIHLQAEQLLGFVLYRLRPEERLHVLANKLSSPQQTGDYENALGDYTWLIDRYMGRPYAEVPEPEASFLRNEEITDWILTFQSDSASLHAIEKWKATKSLLWLTSAIGNMKENDARVESILQATAAVDPSYPGYYTIAYNRLRLLTELKRYDEARIVAKEILAHPKLPMSVENAVKQLRMVTASSLTELLEVSQLSPISIIWSDDITEAYGDNFSRDSAFANTFSYSASYWLNTKLPLAYLLQASESTVLEDSLNLQVALAAWTRAILLGDHTSARRAAQVVVSNAKPEVVNDFKPYLAARDNKSASYEALWILLNNPGLRPVIDGGLGRREELDVIDSYRDNWWPQLDSNELHYFANYYEAQSTPPILLYDPVFLTPSDKQTVNKELAALSLVPTGPNYLAVETLKWAKEKPKDPRIPKALQLAVRSTRYGRTDNNTENYSKAVFQLLHKKYGKTAEAKATPYWFGNN